MGVDLFDESSENDEEDTSPIKISEEYARRFEYNKKREDLQRLEELKKKGIAKDSDESSSEEDEDGDFVYSAEKEFQFWKAFARVKKKDPSLYQKDVKLFVSEDEDEQEKEEKEEKERPYGREKKKSLYLKDVLAKQLIEEGPEFEEETRVPVRKSYLEEQEEYRKAFLGAADEAFKEDQEDLLVEKKVDEEETVADGKDREIERMCHEIFVNDEDETFWTNYVKNWASIAGDSVLKPSQIVICGVSEDEDELDKQDKYESEYNFRFEENAEDRVLGHARFSETSVRKKSSARKIQRKSKEERMAQAEFERKEELKHLKNVKKKEIIDKLERIRSVAGIADDGACALNEDDLEEEFDPEEFDRRMKETFDDDYYDANDVDPNFQSDDGVDDLEKPDFDEEDELLGLPKNWDLVEPGEGFLVAREKIRKDKKSGLKEVNGENAEGLEFLDDKKPKSNGKISFQEKVALDKELEEYYKLDYEDTIGDLKTRFKYTSVPSKRYGLSAAEILMADDTELNQYVPLKKLAPYRQNEYRVSKSKRYSQKMRLKLALKGYKSSAEKVNKKKLNGKGNGQAKTFISRSAGEGKATESEEQNSEVGTLSKRSRKRRRHAALKISQPRLVAYGLIPPKSKIRKKN